MIMIHFYSRINTPKSCAITPKTTFHDDEWVMSWSFLKQEPNKKEQKEYALSILAKPTSHPHQL